MLCFAVEAMTSFLPVMAAFWDQNHRFGVHKSGLERCVIVSCLDVYALVLQTYLAFFM